MRGPACGQAIPAFRNSCFLELHRAEPVLTMQPNHPWVLEDFLPSLLSPGCPQDRPSPALPGPYVASSRSLSASCLPSAQGGAALCPGWASNVPAVDPLAPAMSWSPPPLGTSQIAACGSSDAEVMALEPGTRLVSPWIGRLGYLLSLAMPSSLPRHPSPPRGRQVL